MKNSKLPDFEPAIHSPENDTTEAPSLVNVANAGLGLFTLDSSMLGAGLLSQLAEAKPCTK